jgi:hypothetical protein
MSTSEIMNYIKTSKKNINEIFLRYCEQIIFNDQILDQFIELGLDVNYKHNGTYLHTLFSTSYNLKEHNLCAVKYLLKRGIDVNVLDDNGYCCITIFIEYNNHEDEPFNETKNIINLILDSGYTLQKQSKCILYALNNDLLTFLLQRGFNPNAHFSSGNHYFQQWNRNCDRIDLFLKYGYDVNCGPHIDEIAEKFMFTFRLRRDLQYYSHIPLYQKYCRGKLDFRDPRLQTDLKNISRTLLCIFKHHKITRHIAYICLQLVFESLI